MMIAVECVDHSSKGAYLADVLGVFPKWGGTDVAAGCLAERVGFEPTVPCEDNGFRDRPNRPLSHLSVFVYVMR